MPKETQKISLIPLNEFTTASNDVTLLVTELLHWVSQLQATGGGKTATKMTKAKLVLLNRKLAALKRSIPGLRNLVLDIRKSGLLSRKADSKEISFTK